MTDSVYKVVTLIGTSTESWEKAAKSRNVDVSLGGGVLY